MQVEFENTLLQNIKLSEDIFIQKKALLFVICSMNIWSSKCIRALLYCFWNFAVFLRWYCLALLLTS